MLLDALDAATSVADMRALRAARLHALKGPRKGFWAMTVNARWRITFSFGAGNASDVRIEDYHKG